MEIMQIVTKVAAITIALQEKVLISAVELAKTVPLFAAHGANVVNIIKISALNASAQMKIQFMVEEIFQQSMGRAPVLITKDLQKMMLNATNALANALYALVITKTF